MKLHTKDYLKKNPEAAVVNLGCGLDDTIRKCDNGKCKGYNIDMPDVIAVRNELLPESDRERNIAYDLNDEHWMNEIDAKNGAVFFASGVFYYFRTEDMKVLLHHLFKLADADGFANYKLPELLVLPKLEEKEHKKIAIA